MSVIRLLPLLLLVPMLAMADSDKNFRIVQKQFKPGTTIAIVKDMAISVDGGTFMAEMPNFPLRENKLYYRHKLGPKEFQWGVGRVDVSNFGKLHAFSLKKNHLKPDEVALMRFYGSQNARAFQDEADLYFDREYIYSPRVPKLFFVKNDRWQILNETALPGVINFEVAPDVEIASTEFNLKNKPTTISPVEAGPYVFVFSSPSALPVAEIGVVKSGEALTFKPELLKIQKDSQDPSVISVTMKDVQSTRNLEETEVLYDKLMKELLEDTTQVDMSGFEDHYPQRVVASSIGLPETDDVYQEYVALYKNKRAESQQMFLDSKRGDVGVSRAIRHKLDSLEQMPVRVMLMPTTFEKVYQDGDSTKGVVGVKLVFGADHYRYDVAWTGVAAGTDVETLYSWFAVNRAGMKVYLTMENNKPVWLMDTGVVKSRHHYRFIKVDFVVDGVTYAGQGEFILPEYIAQEQEVQDWLNARKLAAVAPPSSSSAEVSSSSAVADSVPPVNDLPIAPVDEGAPRVIRDRIHGNVAMIDSGSFRYKGSVVSLSPYAIMTTEMTQKLYNEAMNRLDSAKRIADQSTFKHPQKPVHNINWENARFVCQALGGDLPTEAQWEYAARAGGNEGAIWVNDSVPDAGKYAIYRENSYNMSKKEEAYGPQQVASKKPNAWGIYDMSGNVSEWTRDRYFMFSFVIEKSNPTGAMLGSSKIYKGGSWKDAEKYLNTTNRDDEDPRYWSESIGFRCAYPQNIIKE